MGNNNNKWTKCYWNSEAQLNRVGPNKRVKPEKESKNPNLRNLKQRFILNSELRAESLWTKEKLRAAFFSLLRPWQLQGQWKMFRLTNSSRLTLLTSSVLERFNFSTFILIFNSLSFKFHLFLYLLMLIFIWVFLVCFLYVLIYVSVMRFLLVEW